MKPRNRKEGNLVLNVHRDETFDPRGKMKPRWYGPFIIKKIMLGTYVNIELANPLTKRTLLVIR